MNQLLLFLQQGIAAIFRLVGSIWTWVVGEATQMVNLPWATLPPWKLIVLGVGAAGASYLLFHAARALWESAERVLRAFAALLSAFVTALPWAIGAGLIMFVCLWVARTF